MLGRLGMSVDECIEKYKELMESIFGSKVHYLSINLSANVNARYDSNKVKAAIIQVLRQRNVPENSAFNDGKERRCRVFVCCVAKDTGTAVRIRSYNQDLDPNINATICQAALATSAATTFFDPVTIDGCQYIDGALRNNNPVTEVETEAQRLWCSYQEDDLKPLVKCFLSIGTGVPAKVPISDKLFGFLQAMQSITTDTEAINKNFEERWRRHVNEKRSFRFDVAQGLQKVDLADYKMQSTIVELTQEYVSERDQQIKLQDCTENLIKKELRGTPLDFHKTVSNYTLHEIQGSYDIREIRDCRAVLRVTDVEMDRYNLTTDNGERVPGTFDWIITHKPYQDWKSSGPDALWIVAEPGRGKTMLSLFILQDLTQYISAPATLPDSIVQDEHGKKADLYYFFCSKEEGSRRDAVAVFRSLIYQIVSKHRDLMKYVLDYLENNRPTHGEDSPDNGNEKQSRNEQKENEQSRSWEIQNPAEQMFPAPAKFVKDLLPGRRKEAQPEKDAEDGPKNKSNMLQSMLGKSRKEKQSKKEPEKQQGTPLESGPTDPANPPERQSPKSRQLELLDVRELSFILRTLIRELDVDTAYFLLDGVNECVKKEQETLTSTMLKLWDVEPGKFKLLMISRPIGGMGRTPTIRLEDTEQTKGDIEKVVSYNLDQLANVDGFKEVQQEVKQNLLDGSQGTFLWVSLVMREIEKKKTSSEILAATKSVPQGLDNKFSHMLQQIDPTNQRQVAKMLRWVAAAYRPLTLQEFSSVIEAPPSGSIPTEQAVRDEAASAEGLLKIRGNEVAFVHTFAKDFLLVNGFGNEGTREKSPVRLEEMHYEIAQSCYADILNSGLSRFELKVSELSDKEEPKMLKYAIKYWMEHVKASDWAEQNFDPDAEFFRRDSKLRKNWWTAYLQACQKDDPKNFNVASLSHLAAYFGIVTWIKPAYDGKAWVAKKTKDFMELDHYHRTPLHIAVEQGHGPVVSLLLDHGVNIESKELTICEILLDHEARINARNRFDSTPLTEAARGGHLEVVKLLVQRGADINGSIDKNHKSIKRHFESVPGYYKRARGQINGLEYAERSTPVIEAARHNHVDIIRYLIRRGAKIEAKTLEGFNALHIAAYHSQLKSMEVLIELGANIEEKDDYTRTALFIASWQNHADAVQWLLDHDADSDSTNRTGFTPLLIASRYGYVEAMKILLQARAKIEHRDEVGFTPLAIAAGWGKVAAVKLLIDNNAKIDAPTKWGSTPLMRAIQEGLTDDLIETVQLLLKHGADVNCKNHRGTTPLMKAARLSHGDATSIVQCVVEKGAHVDAKDDEGRTALMQASKGGSNKTREVLLDRGAALEAKDLLGDTALIIAAGYSDPSAVELLLERGADIGVGDNFGLTPLLKAAKCGFDDTVSLLLDRGALITAEDNEGKTALDHAATRERGNVIKLLKARGASGHNLTMTNRATATLSNVMYWTEEACRKWERDWEMAELKKMSRSSSNESVDDASTKEQTEQEVLGDADTDADVDSERTLVKLLDEDSPQINAEERTRQEIQGTQHDQLPDVRSTEKGTDLTKGSLYSGAEKKTKQEASNLEG
ncbi:hypothetical protein MMC17_006158 [Xylographa soralifera]|nr:hypothetical protein [Xylographa soralifera]